MISYHYVRTEKFDIRRIEHTIFVNKKKFEFTPDYNYCIVNDKYYFERGRDNDN